MEVFRCDWGQFGVDLLKLSAVFLLTMPIAWEREQLTRIMGLRTFPLVAVSSCGYVLIALAVIDASKDAQARIIQGLMSGMGFIGGGAILKEGANVRGTATAASVWATGAIGAAIAYSRYVAGTPLPVLRSWLSQYKGYYEAPVQPLCRLQVPRAQVSLIFGFGDDLRIRLVDSQSDPKALQSFVVGIEAGSLITEHCGARSCIEVPLSPCVSYRLFQGAATEFTTEVVALEDIWGKDANHLTAQMSELSSWSKRFALIDRVLAEKIAQSSYRVRPEIRWAWNQLKSRGGCLPIRQLAKAIGWSDRHFAKCFREHIGITPKVAARQIRFSQAHHLLTVGEEQPLSEIALTCGYSDQSHLTREFHAFSGCSPKTLQKGYFTDFPGIPADIVPS